MNGLNAPERKGITLRTLEHPLSLYANEAEEEEEEEEEVEAEVLLLCRESHCDSAYALISR